MTIKWTKAPRIVFWTGSVGPHMPQSEAFGISRSFGPEQPLLRIAKLRKTPRRFSYVLHTRLIDGFARRVGERYATLEDAKAAAEQFLATL